MLIPWRGHTIPKFLTLPTIAATQRTKTVLVADQGQLPGFRSLALPVAGHEYTKCGLHCTMAGEPEQSESPVLTPRTRRHRKKERVLQCLTRLGERDTLRTATEEFASIVQVSLPVQPL